MAADDTPSSLRLRRGLTLMRGCVEGAVRTLSITTGAGFVIMSIVIVAEGDLLSAAGILVILGLSMLFAAALVLDIAMHRYYARNTDRVE